MKLIADINECYIADWETNTGEVNARVLEVEMCEQLCSCANAFVLYELKDGTKYISKITDGKAEIPPFEKSQFVKIGVYSTDIEGDVCKKRYSPRPVSVFVPAGSYSGNGTEAPTPTAGTFEELLATINEIDKKTIETLESVNIWELEAGAYFVTNSVCEATPNPPQYPNNIALKHRKSLLLVTKEIINASRNYILFAGKHLYFGNSFFNGFVAEGKCTRIIANVSETITENSDEELITAKAVYDFGLNALYIPLMTALNGKENTINKTTVIDEDSTHKQFATAKAVYDFGVAIFNEINGNLDVISSLVGGAE